MVAGIQRHSSKSIRIDLMVLPSVRFAAPMLWLTLASLVSLALMQNVAAVDVDLPSIDPTYSIRVEADTVAKERRGAYDILAFAGNCVLDQGKLHATSDEVILWIERFESTEVTVPGKTICYFSGNVVAKWGQGQGLRDQRWMVRLFSLHPILHSRAEEVPRYNIPNLDWNHEPGAVQLAQFTQGVGGNGPVFAPPLLSQSGNFGDLPTPQAPASQVPITPGAVQWGPPATSPPAVSTQPNNSHQVNLPQGGGTQLIPNSGLVFPSDGGQPFPAAGVTPQPPQPGAIVPAFPPPATQVTRQAPTPNPLSAKTVQFFPRDKQTEISSLPDTGRGEWITQVRGGFRLVVNGIQVTNADGSVVDYGSVTLEADNAVMWVRSDGEFNVFNSFASTPDRPIELYLDGNIVFSQGNRVIYADRMYYNVSSEYGMVLSAEVLTPVPQYQGLLRLKADVLQQRDSKHFKAFGAAITSSRLGVPRYWLQAGEVEFEDERTETDLSVFAPTDANRETNLRLRAKSNLVYLAGVPIFYWPTFKTNLAQPTYYLSSLGFKNDTIFGFQTFAETDVYHLLGIEGPRNTSLRLSVDYLSLRGPAIGTRFDYNRPTLLGGIPGQGFSDAWFIRDEGLDILGSDRVNLTPEAQTRGRVISRHRLFLSDNWELMAESGWISDRNFLEQFFPQLWDQEKDHSTTLRLRRYNGNRMFDVFGQARVNDFFTETEWLPRIDHYWLGQDVLNERLTWSAHSSVGYAHQKVASTPTAPADAAKFALLPWETDSEGLRATTRQELSMPVSFGAWKLVPFLSGEAAFWNEDINQEDVTRLTGQAGVRSALPMWRVYPNVENRLFDLRGIAHKITLESEFFYADSNEDFDRLPLYDPLDDNSQEHFRRRLIFNTFGGTLPPEFDERNYALRNGLQRWVTASSTEIMDDLTQLRMGVNQRWQTKRGLPGKERIVDLVAFDVDFIYFPRAERDNFGEDVGAFNYDFRYQVGDRLTLLSDGYLDVFSQGLKSVSVGAQMSRQGRGDVYIGFLSIEGPISANVLNGYTNYRLNEKWIVTGGSAFDFASTGSIGHSLGLTRIGESALIRVGMNIDSGRDNATFNFSIEPRFLPTVRLGGVGGELVPPAGLFGLE